MITLKIFQEIAEDGYLHIKVPENMGKNFEVMLIPVEHSDENFFGSESTDENASVTETLMEKVLRDRAILACVKHYEMKHRTIDSLGYNNSCLLYTSPSPRDA